MLAWVTAGSTLPGVQDGSGSIPWWRVWQGPDSEPVTSPGSWTVSRVRCLAWCVAAGETLGAAVVGGALMMVAGGVLARTLVAAGVLDVPHPAASSTPALRAMTADLNGSPSPGSWTAVSPQLRHGLVIPGQLVSAGLAQDVGLRLADAFQRPIHGEDSRVKRFVLTARRDDREKPLHIAHRRVGVHGCRLGQHVNHGGAVRISLVRAGRTAAACH